MYINESKVKLFGTWVNGKRTYWLNEKEVEELKNKNDENYIKIINYSSKENMFD